MQRQIVIDGYNFIKNARGYRCDWGNIRASKERLLENLFSFNGRRNYTITVVYDGWKSGGLTESYEKIGGIHVIHSRKGETADKVIIRLCEEYPGDSLVVTADREIISAVVNNGGIAVTPAEFQEKLSFRRARTMNGGGEEHGDYHEPRPTGPRKKGPARRPPKAGRRRRNILNGL